MAYETQFTQDNIVAMTTYIQEQIAEYADAKGEKLDVFVILASLGSVGYNYVMNTLPRNDEEKERLYNEMKGIGSSLTTKLDAHRLEHKTLGISDLAAVAHIFSLLSEYYARLRDDSIKKLEAATPAPAQDEAVNE